MKTYEVGDTVRLSVTFRNAAGALANPNTVTLKVEDPSGTETEYTAPTNVSTGRYHQDVSVNSPGTWHWRWQGSGGGLGTGASAVAEGSFVVRRSAFS